MSPTKPDDRLTETRLAKQKPLSTEDVVALMVDKSDEQRAITAHKVGLVYANHPELSDRSRKIGIEIFRIMVNDVAVRVRQELAETLKSSHDLPSDIAIALSKDVDSVSLPFIESSLSLTDDDLLHLIDTLDETGQKAIANRSRLTETVAVGIATKAHPRAVATLLDNPAAPVNEEVIDKIMEREALRQDQQFRSAILSRMSKFPQDLGEKVKALIAAPLQEYLTKSNRVEAGLAQTMVSTSIVKGIERSLNPTGARPPTPPTPVTPLTPPKVSYPPTRPAPPPAPPAAPAKTLHSLPNSGTQQEVEFQVERLLSSNRLTASYVLRCFAIGELLHAEVGLARLARIEVNRIRTLIYDSGQLGFKAVFERARLPTSYYESFRLVLAAIREAADLYPPQEMLKRQQLLHDRMFAHRKQFHPEDMDYLNKRFELLGVKLHG